MNPKTQFIFSLLKTSAHIERKLDRALSATKGVSFSEYHLLNELQEQYGGAATRMDLARAAGLTASAVTRALKPLEKIGFVTTEKNGPDARTSTSTLTPAGRELLADASQIILDEINLLSIPDSGVDGALEILAALKDKPTL